MGRNRSSSRIDSALRHTIHSSESMPHQRFARTLSAGRSSDFGPLSIQPFGYLLDSNAALGSDHLKYETKNPNFSGRGL